MKTASFLILLIVVPFIQAISQNYFRSGIFLHHSTGEHIWGPNPDGTSTTTIPDQMHLYNLNHGLTGNDSISMTQEWWSPGDNEWWTQHQFFEGNTTFTDINFYLSNYKILVVKSCFPSSEVDSWGQPSDTTDPGYKSVYNYKWHWRHILKVMKDHPQNFFAIWTNAPLEINSTNASQAALSKKFCRWAKDTLATGLDPVFGAFPLNVYVFDYFGKMTDANGYELPQYVTASGDSHPNGAATDFIAPQFVNEIFSAAIYYETHYNGMEEQNIRNSLICYPNPVQSTITFYSTLSKASVVFLTLYNAYGVKVFEGSGRGTQPTFDLSGLNPGIYFYQYKINDTIYSGKLIRQ